MPPGPIDNFKRIVAARSQENLQSITALFQIGNYGNCFSLLRQELDSLIRVCYLNALTSRAEKLRLIADLINGNRWRIGSRIITDKAMVTQAATYNHWAPDVYKVGNHFTHLSNFHDYKTNDPCLTLGIPEKQQIKTYLNQYHGFPLTDDITFENILPYILQIANKVNNNLTSYLSQLN